MQLVLKVRGKAKPVYRLVPTSADLDEGASVVVQVLKNDAPGRILSAVSSDGRFAAHPVPGDPSSFGITFVGPADPVTDLPADIAVEVE